MAGSFVIGLGAGVIILLIIWALVILAWVQLSPEQGTLRTLLTLVSILITAILLLIPTDDGKKEEDGIRDPDLIHPKDMFPVYDYMFIWKGILMFLLASGILASLGVYMKDFWSMKIHASAPLQMHKGASSSSASF